MKSSINGLFQQKQFLSITSRFCSGDFYLLG